MRLSILLFAFSLFVYTSIAQADHELASYRWIGPPTVLKTSRVFGDNGARCREKQNFELCIGPARPTGATTPAKLIKCFIPPNTYTCPLTITEANGCRFAGAEGNATPPVPACTSDRQYDGFEGGCNCSNYGYRSRRGTSATCEQLMDQGRATSVAQKCCTGSFASASCVVQAGCATDCTTYANNATVAASCPNPTPNGAGGAAPVDVAETPPAAAPPETSPVPEREPHCHTSPPPSGPFGSNWGDLGDEFDFPRVAERRSACAGHHR